MASLARSRRRVWIGARHRRVGQQDERLVELVHGRVGILELQRRDGGLAKVDGLKGGRPAATAGGSAQLLGWGTTELRVGARAWARNGTHGDQGACWAGVCHLTLPKHRPRGGTTLRLPPPRLHHRAAPAAGAGRGAHLSGLKPGTAPIIADGICGGAPYAGGTCCGTVGTPPGGEGMPNDGTPCDTGGAVGTAAGGCEPYCGTPPGYPIGSAGGRPM